MDAAVLQERVDPPGLLEIVAVLIVCAGVIAGLAALDERAARREAARAHEVLAERASRAGQRASREAMTAPAAPAGARTDRVGREHSPIVIPAGSAWGPGTSVVSHTQSAGNAPTPAQVLRRTEGPRAATAESAIPEPPLPQSAASGALVATAAGAPRTDAGPVLLLLMGGAGLSLAGGGLRLLSRRSA